MSLPAMDFAQVAQTILVMSVSGSVIALLLFLLKPFIKDMLPKAVQYYMWIVVLVALIVPVSRIVVLPSPPPSGNGALSLTPIYDVVQQGFLSESETPGQFTAMPPSTSEPEARQEAQSQSRLPGAAAVFSVVWLFGALVCLVRSTIRYLQFARNLNRRAIPANEHETAMLQGLSGLRCIPRLCRNPLAPMPMLIGLLRPTIMLPDREYTDAQLRNILRHELTHYRRRDIVMKWLSVLACALHWFNPVIYLARREINSSCELACDEAVIRNLDSNGKQNYGDTLIAVAAEHRIPQAALSTTMCEEKKALMVRLAAIKKHRRFSKASVVLSCIMLAAVLCGITVLGAAGGAGAAGTADVSAAPGYEIQHEEQTGEPRITGDGFYETIAQYTENDTVSTEPPRVVILPQSSDFRSMVIANDGILMTDPAADTSEYFTLKARVEPAGTIIKIIWAFGDWGLFKAIVTNPEGTEAMLTGFGRGWALLSVNVGGDDVECLVRVQET